jgi:gas vesicle protein
MSSLFMHFRKTASKFSNQWFPGSAFLARPSLFKLKETLFIQGEIAMDNQEIKCSAQAVVLAFLGGAVAGVVAGLLLAPKSGEEARRALKGYARRAEEEAVERAKEGRATLDQTIESGKHFIAENTEDVEAAVKAGREAMKEKMDKCSS